MVTGATLQKMFGALILVLIAFSPFVIDAVYVPDETLDGPQSAAIGRTHPVGTSAMTPLSSSIESQAMMTAFCTIVGLFLVKKLLDGLQYLTSLITCRLVGLTGQVIVITSRLEGSDVDVRTLVLPTAFQTIEKSMEDTPNAKPTYKVVINSPVSGATLLLSESKVITQTFSVEDAASAWSASGVSFHRATLQRMFGASILRFFVLITFAPFVIYAVRAPDNTPDGPQSPDPVDTSAMTPLSSLIESQTMMTAFCTIVGVFLAKKLLDVLQYLCSPVTRRLGGVTGKVVVITSKLEGMDLAVQTPIKPTTSQTIEKCTEDAHDGKPTYKVVIQSPISTATLLLSEAKVITQTFSVQNAASAWSASIP